MYIFIHYHSSFTVQWLGDVNQKVMLENGSSVPIILLANKVCGSLVPRLSSACMQYCTLTKVNAQYCMRAEESLRTRLGMWCMVMDGKL